jgi:hypothetical protein
MKISARACGGFAGLAQAYDLDTACHPGGGELETMIDRLDFFSAAPSCPVGADLPRWEITVEDGQRCHTVFLREDGGSGDWQMLLERLRASA